MVDASASLVPLTSWGKPQLGYPSPLAATKLQRWSCTNQHHMLSIDSLKLAQTTQTTAILNKRYSPEPRSLALAIDVIRIQTVVNLSDR